MVFVFGCMFHFLIRFLGMVVGGMFDVSIWYLFFSVCWAISSMVLYSLAVASSYFVSSLALLSALFIRSAMM